MNVAIVGAAGGCGRQLAVQLLDRRILPSTARLQLIGHRGGPARMSCGDCAPIWKTRLATTPRDRDGGRRTGGGCRCGSDAGGMTISTDPNAPVDRAALGQANYKIFVEYAAALAARSGLPPTVVVQSNPVELGVQIFAERLGRQHVLGAAAWSDTLRLRAELAEELGVRRPQVRAWMLGQHGDYLAPIWSQTRAWGVEPETTTAMVARVRAGRTLADLPQEVRAHKAELLELVRNRQVRAAYEMVQSLPPDLRAAVKPFFTHFTAGHTTEIVTAHAVADILAALVTGRHRVFPHRWRWTASGWGCAAWWGAGGARAGWMGAHLPPGAGCRRNCRARNGDSCYCRSERRGDPSRANLTKAKQ